MRVRRSSASAQRGVEGIEAQRARERYGARRY
jgi:hypothetical protein